MSGKPTPGARRPGRAKERRKVAEMMSAGIYPKETYHKHEKEDFDLLKDPPDKKQRLNHISYEVQVAVWDETKIVTYCNNFL